MTEPSAEETVSDEAVEAATAEALRSTWPPRMYYPDIMRDALTAALPFLTAGVVAAAVKAEQERLISPEFMEAVAKASWDRGEADYWDHEVDRRPFDPSITELDSDDADRGRDWLAQVTEVLTDAAIIARGGTP